MAVAPSPKDHDQEVIAVLPAEEVSVKATLRGYEPLDVETENEAVGETGTFVTVMSLVNVSLPCGLETVKETE